MTTRDQSFWDVLSADDVAALKPTAQRRFLPRGDVLLHRGDEVSTVYLPVTADILNQVHSEDGGSIMTANVGREGVTGLAAFLAKQPIGWDLIVQVEGDAIAIPAPVFRAQTERSPNLLAALIRLTHFHQVESAQNTLCTARHTVQARVARLLLELHGRTGKSEFDLTQEEISARLGAQRTTVNTAWGNLAGQGAVRGSRGRVRLVDSQRLQQQACRCYAALSSSRFWPLTSTV